MSVSLLLLGFARRQLNFWSLQLDMAFSWGFGTDADLQLEAQEISAGLAVLGCTTRYCTLLPALGLSLVGYRCSDNSVFLALHPRPGNSSHNGVLAQQEEAVVLP